MKKTLDDKKRRRKRRQPSQNASRPMDASDAETAAASDRQYAVTPTDSGVRLALDELTVEANSSQTKGDAVRATVSVWRAGKLLHRDHQLNLTSAKSRAVFLNKLNTLGAQLDEAALIALEEACRVRPKPASAAPSPTEASAPSEPLDMQGLAAVVGKWLLIEDDAHLAVLVGAVVAHRLMGAPVWLLIVGPPSSAKSELLRALVGCPGIFPLSDLSARTFVSGLKAADADPNFHGNDPSLLARLKDEVLVFKDLTTMLEKRSEERQEILAQLREIYDGRLDRVWGTGRELHWEGRLGLIAGVTEVIERHHATMAVLGERFVLLRPKQPDRVEVGHMALDGNEHEAEMRADLAAAMRRFLGSRGTTCPTVDEIAEATLVRAADCVTRARSPVVRHGFSRDIEWVPDPEGPARFAKVLRSLACGIALAHDRTAVTERDLQLVLRVAADSIPRRRHAILAAILAASRPVRHADLAAQLAAKTSPTAVRRELEELEALGLAARVGTKPQAGDEWQLTPATAALARDVLNLPPGSVSPADSVETGAWQRYLRGPGPMLHALAELGVATFTDWLAASGLRKATFARYLSEMVAVPSEVVRRTDGRYTLVTEELRDTYLRLATLWRRVTQLRGSASTEQAP